MEAQPEVLVPHRLVFLDVDGVMNDQMWAELQPQKLELLRELVRRTGATIVLSSMWRLTKKDRALVRAALLRGGLPPVLSHTPKIDHGHARTAEILSWLRLNTDAPLGWWRLKLDAAKPQFRAKHWTLPQRIAVARWVVLDDLDLSQAHRGLGYETLAPHFVRTNARRGLSPHNLEQAVRVLTGSDTPTPLLQSAHCEHCREPAQLHDARMNATFCGNHCRLEYRDWHNL